ncbi:hypothetical protein [Microbacterium sp. gxy059]|uniref:hypothetical protein n=1 Tax=Microbacterium sp. gxy059 TaxID=2957199 RepID=UPI003D9542BB
MSGFVIEYDRRSGDRRVYEFAGPDGHRAALEHRFTLESRHDGDGWEVVSLVSDSIETVKKTHSRYFRGRELVAG